MLIHNHHLALCFLFPVLCLLIAPTIHAYPMNGVNLTLINYSIDSKESCSSEYNYQTGIAFYVASLTEQNQFASDSAYQCQARDDGGFCCWSTSTSLTGRSYLLYNFAVHTGCIDTSSCVGAVEFTYSINATKLTGYQVMDFEKVYNFGKTFAPGYHHNMTTDAIQVMTGDFGYYFTVTPLLDV